MARDTQFSFPQAGLQPADGIDCGAYTANEYKAMYIAYMRSGGMIRTGAVLPGLPATPPYPDVGVFYAVPDRLAVTSSGAALISIATGAYICDGAFGYNDTAIVDTAVTLPAANPRIDRVVIRQNYTAADYTSVNVPALVVPANTARLCVISGAEAGAPVEPALTQDQDRLTYWDIPLFQYQIANATGAISGLTDEREWVDAETKHFFVPAGHGYDNTAAAPLDPQFFTAGGGGGDVGPVFWFQQNRDCFGLGSFNVPQDYISSMTATAVGTMSGVAAGNIVFQNIYSAGECTEQVDVHTNSTALTTLAVPGAAREYWCIVPITVANIGVDDYVLSTFYRWGANVADTEANTFQFHGWDIEYLGWGRK